MQRSGAMVNRFELGETNQPEMSAQAPQSDWTRFKTIFAAVQRSKARRLWIGPVILRAEILLAVRWPCAEEFAPLFEEVDLTVVFLLLAFILLYIQKLSL